MNDDSQASLDLGRNPGEGNSLEDSQMFLEMSPLVGKTFTSRKSDPENGDHERTTTGLRGSSPVHQVDCGSADESDGKEYRFFAGSYIAENGKEPVESRGRLSVPRWRYGFYSLLVVLDIVMMLIAVCAVFLTWRYAYDGVKSHGPHSLELYVLMLCVIWIVSLFATGTYARHVMGEGDDLYTKIVNAMVVNFITVSAVSYLFSMDLPRSLAIFTSLLGGLFTCIERCGMRHLLRRRRREGKNAFNAVIVGSPDGIHDLVARLQSNVAAGYAPIAVCPIQQTAWNPDTNAPQRLAPATFVALTPAEGKLRVLPFNSHLAQIAKHYGAHTVMVADVISRESSTMRALALSAESQGLELALTANVADVDGAQMRMRNIPDMPILTASLPQYSWMTRFWKRFFDIVVSVVGIILAGIPMIITAILIRHEDGGPAIYKQKRIGLYGKPFTIYKFRSMRVDADKIDAKLAEEMGVEHAALFKLKNDPRITKIGKFIRKTSIDELPQLFNVLNGTMSLVGPRPQQKYEVDQYGALYSTRLLVKPGITGPWQVSGRSDLSQQEAERLDVSYVENWSLTGDFVLLVKTVGAVLSARGSY